MLLIGLRNIHGYLPPCLVANHCATNLKIRRRRAAGLAVGTCNVRKSVQVVETPLEASRAFALFDASGAARGTSSAPVSAMNGARTISDWLPEIDSYRWATLWAGIEFGREEKFWTISHVAGGADGEAYVTIRSVIQDGERYAGVEVRPSTETTTKLRLSALQQEVLEAVASGAPIVDCMTILCRHAEELAPSVVCSVLAGRQRRQAASARRARASPSLLFRCHRRRRDRPQFWIVRDRRLSGPACHRHRHRH